RARGHQGSGPSSLALSMMALNSFSETAKRFSMRNGILVLGLPSCSGFAGLIVLQGPIISQFQKMVGFGQSFQPTTLMQDLCERQEYVTILSADFAFSRFPVSNSRASES